MPFQHRTRLSRIFAPALSALALGAGAGVAWSLDCDVNAMEAYNTAKLRGWQFDCFRYLSLGGHAMVAGLVTYPPDKFGCVYKTPAVLGTINAVGQGRFFKRSAGSRPDLKNGWKLKSFEVSGVQWEALGSGGIDPDIRLAFRILDTPKPNWTYNVRVSRLTLTKSGGVCSKAVDDAF
jgi:hypothetical protein